MHFPTASDFSPRAAKRDRATHLREEAKKIGSPLQKADVLNAKAEALEEAERELRKTGSGRESSCEHDARQLL